MNETRNVEFNAPARYRIVTTGPLSETSRRGFGGMTVEVGRGDGALPRTVLVGRVQDQTELRGVLDALYGLHLSLITLEMLDDSPKKEKE